MSCPPDVGLMGVLSRDGKTLLLSSEMEAAVLYDIKTGKKVGTLKGDEKMPGPSAGPEPKPLPYSAARLENRTRHLALSRDGRWLAVGTEGGWLSVWDVQKRKRLWRKKASDRPLLCLSISPDGKWVTSHATLNPCPLTFWARQDGRRAVTVNQLSVRSEYLPGGDMIVSRNNRAGFVRWSPRDDVYRVGPSWGEDKVACRGTEFDDFRVVQYPESLAVSHNGKAVALITRTREQGFRVTVFDLTRVRWRKR